MVRRRAGDQKVGPLQNTIIPFSALVMKRMRITYKETLRRHSIYDETRERRKGSSRISYHLTSVLEPVRELLLFLRNLTTEGLATDEDKGLTCRHIYGMCMYAESLLHSPIGVRIGHENKSLPVANDYIHLSDCLWAWDNQLEDCLRNPNWSPDRTTLEEDLQRLQQTDKEVRRRYGRDWFPQSIVQMKGMLEDESMEEIPEDEYSCSASAILSDQNDECSSEYSQGSSMK